MKDNDINTQEELEWGKQGAEGTSPESKVRSGFI